ncbi:MULTISPECIES: preprotein translocase subunit SecE [unclassified Actinomyces]|jgi:preprotein translocase, secE subunit|uniref:preprotein translocase subunit SecE n=1 Tax=unclassified Actinomyces TaxID=2609248 RepID=UPI000D022F7A|nr:MULTISPECIES: preprotein translocase subunit SecE [unclassified Actinomyces]AVM61866.1 preprotein translocase subunit SecE [Actinomyces sp. oral taxon 897]QQO78612.1 preprotein translocase subunit SecE [Actinomyces sp. HMT897]
MSETVTAPAGKKRNVFARIARFFREVVDELRKVVWPTWNELTTYFVVVIVFIAAIMVFTGALDMIFDRIVMWGLA